MSFDLFMIDPPWPQRKGGKRAVRPRQDRKLDYRVMSVDSIFSLLDAKVFSQANVPHAAFIWTIDKFLPECEAKMLSRDYRLHARIIWDKGNGVAPAFSVRYSHEYLLWYYKPKFMPVEPETRGRYMTVIRAPGREHSRKPDEAYKMVEALYPSASRLDVFSREARVGWNQFGDQLNWFHRPLTAPNHTP